MTPATVTANLPSRDFDATEAFYAGMGFRRRYRDDGWLILERDGALVEFFPHPELNPRESWFSASLRSPGIDALRDAFAAMDLPQDRTSIPRITGIFQQGSAPRMFALIDPDGSLWRVLEWGETA